MRKLSPSEIRLLALFGAAVFLAVNMFGIRAWTTRSATMNADISSARSAVANAKSLLMVAETLKPAKDWMEQNPAPATTGENASTKLLDSVRSIAESSGLKIVEETLLPGEHGAGTEAAVLHTKMNGPFVGLAKFLFALQNPTDWRAVQKLSIRSDNEPPNVIAEIEIRQYYRRPTSTGPGNQIQ